MKKFLQKSWESLGIHGAYAVFWSLCALIIWTSLPTAYPEEPPQPTLSKIERPGPRAYVFWDDSARLYQYVWLDDQESQVIFRVSSVYGPEFYGYQVAESRKKLDFPGASAKIKP